MVARGLGHLSLPIAIIPHPVGDSDPALIMRKGIDVAAECIRMLTTPNDELDAEFRTAKYPLPPASVPK
ncbi:MAG: hypothetical protein JWN94_3162 [Betaproteobacteria bacterium]|nr:hypothetical protein [Betaproteobacteria bacterium]